MSNVMLDFSKSVLMKKQTHLGWPEGEYMLANFHFWVNYSIHGSFPFHKRFFIVEKGSLDF